MKMQKDIHDLAEGYCSGKLGIEDAERFEKMVETDDEAFEYWNCFRMEYASRQNIDSVRIQSVRRESSLKLWPLLISAVAGVLSTVFVGAIFLSVKANYSDKKIAAVNERLNDDQNEIASLMKEQLYEEALVKVESFDLSDSGYYHGPMLKYTLVLKKQELLCALDRHYDAEVFVSNYLENSSWINQKQTLRLNLLTHLAGSQSIQRKHEKAIETLFEARAMLTRGDFSTAIESEVDRRLLWAAIESDNKKLLHWLSLNSFSTIDNIRLSGHVIGEIDQASVSIWRFLAGYKPNDPKQYGVYQVTLSNLVAAYIGRGDYESARSTLSKSRLFEAENGLTPSLFTHLQTGMLLIEEGKPNDANEQFELATSLANNSTCRDVLLVQLYCEHGKALASTGNAQQARICFDLCRNLIDSSSISSESIDYVKFYHSLFLKDFGSEVEVRNAKLNLEELRLKSPMFDADKRPLLLLVSK